MKLLKNYGKAIKQNNTVSSSFNLVYIWVEQIVNTFYDHIGFCFNSKYHIQFNNNKLSIIDNKDYINNFYQIGKSNTVSSLTCIVGENGAGKTGLLELINEILYLVNSYSIITENNFLLVYEKNNEIKYFNNSSPNNCKNLNIETQTEKSVIHVSLEDLKEDFNDLNVIRYSTLFDDSSYLQKMYPDNKSFFIDLTTSNLLQKYKHEFKVNNQISNPDSLNIYKTMELKKKIMFFSHLLKKGENKFKKFLTDDKYFKTNFTRDTFTIKAFNLKYDKTHKDHYKSAFVSKKDLIDLYNYIDKISEQLNELLTNKNTYEEKRIKKSNYFLAQIFFSYWLLIVDTLTDDVKSMEFKTDEIISDKFNIDNYMTKTIEAIEYIVNQLSEELKTKYKNSINNFNSFINLLKKEEYYIDSALTLKINEDKDKILNLIENYANSLSELRFGEYATFSFEPRSCSGEQNLLTLFSRLNYLKQNKKNIKLANNILLLIDEGETTFHPAWQKKYIMVLIEYLLFLFKGKNIQIILTTNSPIILSDIINQDIIFLNNKKMDNNSNKKTFAAEINSLYTDSFFIQDGLMGNFAQKKLEPIVKYINSKKRKITKTEIDKYKQIINLIGDTNIRNYLSNMLDRKLLQTNNKEE